MQLLYKHFLSYLISTHLQPPTFMQDNAPFLTAREVKSFLWIGKSVINAIGNIFKLIGDRAHFKNHPIAEESMSLTP